MSRNEWENLGDQILSIVNNAVKDGNYKSLNESINDVLAHSIDTGSDALKDVLSGVLGAGGRRPASPPLGKETGRESSPYQKAVSSYRPGNPEHSATAYETHNHHGYQVPPFGSSQMVRADAVPTSLFVSTNTPRLKATGMTLAGGLLSLHALGGLFEYMLTAHYGFFSGFGLGAAVFFGALGGWLLYKGTSTLGLIKRFRIYRKSLGNKSYVELSRLSALVNRPVSFVVKDVRQMIEKGWFKEGHLDDEETTLIASNETYQQYLESSAELRKRRQEDEERKAREKKEAETAAAKARANKEVQDVLDKGNAYIDRIHRCNDAIPGEEISAKISRMELLVRRIFERAEAHPEIIPDLKKMMNYYLPTTVKLLEAYEDMDRQPVQGENIRNSKREIEETIDTLNLAFERLLDSIFQDTAWDVSSDISVLNTMLAQEGLKGDDFRASKEKADKENQQGVTMTL